jgi:hypothetical protein
MKNLRNIALLAVIVSITFGIVLYYFYPELDEDKTNVFLIKTLFTSFVTFAIITIGGLFVKTTIDFSIEKDRANKIKEERIQTLRSNFINELTQIYSGFYSIRKLYHSVLDEENLNYNNSDNEKTMLFRDLLAKSVDLEGRYGALKVNIAIYYNLELDKWGSKNIDKLNNALKKETDPKIKYRLKLDLIGEYFDEWRHSIEKEEEIDDKVFITVHYTEVLSFLNDNSIYLISQKI